MALYLPDADALFVHIPKCGGHFVEAALTHLGVRHEMAEPVRNVCPRHGRASDYRSAKHVFCTMRPVDNWMMSYWRFHLCNGNRLQFEAGREYPHKRFGASMPDWQAWTQKRTDAERYLDEMAKPCTVLNLAELDTALPAYLQSIGYDVAPTIGLQRVNPTILKVELGGGPTSMDGFVNVDVLPSAHLQWNLDTMPWPFPDASVNEVYSSHCVEHLADTDGVLQEIARICAVGSRVVIRVPHPHADMAMCAGHTHTVSEQQIRNNCVHFADRLFPGPRRLKHVSTQLRASERLSHAKRELPFLRGLDDQVIMRWIPGTCHESEFVFEVAET